VADTVSSRGLTAEQKLRLKGVREMVTTLGRFRGEARERAAVLVERSLNEVRDRAKATVVRGKETRKGRMKLYRSIRAKKAKDFDVEPTGIVRAYAQHGFVIEHGTTQKGREPRPYLYPAFDAVAVGFERDARRIISDEAIRRAARGR